MPKKILYESAVHQFLWAGRRLREKMAEADPETAVKLSAWINALKIENPGRSSVRLSWAVPTPGEHHLDLTQTRFYTRGDSAPHTKRQTEEGLIHSDDQVMARNMAFFDGELRQALVSSGFSTEEDLEPYFARTKDAARKHAEEIFHDQWAAEVDVTKINVRQMNEACTAPEMRYIQKALGKLSGRTLLDIGCGLGEASVYFALMGAKVTATDISPGMCATAQRLAGANGVRINTHVSAAEDLGLPSESKFDIIYTGNTLHHVDIATTLPQLLRHLNPEGIFVSWDPVAYNPVINYYRRNAMGVRTDDEHPLKLKDIRFVQSHFQTSRVRWFWLSTLLIFISMALVQRRDPNKERYWKKVIEEADDWAWLYKPLAVLDKILLIIPFLRPLCWNAVIVGQRPRQ